MSKKDKYYAPDLLVSRFDVSQINKVWTLDDVSIQIIHTNKTLKILHVIDLATRKILKTWYTLNDFNAAHITRAVQLLLISQNVQEFDDEELRLIIHTDRDYHFISKTWWTLFYKNPRKIRISMSPAGTPKHNAVSERFNRNIKHMRYCFINEFNQEVKFYIIDQIEQLTTDQHKMTNYARIINNFIKYYNNKHIHKTIKDTPSKAHIMHQYIEPIIGDSTIVAVRNNESSPIEHRIQYHQYKERIYKTYNKAQELIKTHPLDLNGQYIVQHIQGVVQTEIAKLAALNQAQFIVLNEQIENANQVLRKLEDKLIKTKSKHVTLPLRDPIAKNIYDLILNQILEIRDSQQLIAYAQFRICAVLLYTTGSRINEIRHFTLEDYTSIRDFHKFQNLQPKVNEPRFCIIGEKGIKEFDRIENDIKFIFYDNKFKYLGATKKHPNETMHPQSWIRSINKTLKKIRAELGVHLVLKSHSFRVSFVTRHLKVADIQKVAELIGHKSLNTTRRYNRYLLNTEENKVLTNKAFDVDI